MMDLIKLSLTATAAAAVLGFGHTADAAWTETNQPVSLVSTTPFFAQNTEKQNYQKLAQNKISASRAKSIARRYVGGGEVVDISRTGSTYRVRVIAKDGRVVDVYIDAKTGRVKK